MSSKSEQTYYRKTFIFLMDEIKRKGNKKKKKKKKKNLVTVEEISLESELHNLLLRSVLCWNQALFLLPLSGAPAIVLTYDFIHACNYVSKQTPSW